VEVDPASVPGLAELIEWARELGPVEVDEAALLVDVLRFAQGKSKLEVEQEEERS
jgi:hypothetical protein